jgi:hypothetical protein
MKGSKIKVVVGQVWQRIGVNNVKYTISRIDQTKHKCFYNNGNGEGGFGPLTEDGFPLGWGDGWEMVGESPKPAKAKDAPSASDNELYSFFAKVAPGECDCKIPKSQCWMHRDS